ncbi:MAG: SRPBCC family protein [Bacteriovoracaceae bacterium]
MTKLFTATVSKNINADTARVWKALITPEIIKQYLFGTETESKWTVGSPIYFRGEYQGKIYEDKGVILELHTEKLLRYTYWSSMAGTSDIPENYVVVSYELLQHGTSTELTIVQDGIKTEESKKHSEQNWGMVLESIKKIVEGM